MAAVTASGPEIVELQQQEAVAVRGDCPMVELPAFFDRAFHQAAEAATKAGVAIVGPPFGYYPRMPAATVVVEAGFPVSAPVADTSGAHRLVLPGGRAAQVVHVGSFATLEQTYAELQAWMIERGLEPGPAVWECYLSDPASEPDPAGWRTLVIWPLA